MSTLQNFARWSFSDGCGWLGEGVTSREKVPQPGLGSVMEHRLAEDAARASARVLKAGRALGEQVSGSEEVRGSPQSHALRERGRTWLFYCSELVFEPTRCTRPWALCHQASQTQRVHCRASQGCFYAYMSLHIRKKQTAHLWRVHGKKGRGLPGAPWGLGSPGRHHEWVGLREISMGTASSGSATEVEGAGPGTLSDTTFLS